MAAPKFPVWTRGLAALTLALALAGPAAAGDVSARDAKAVRAVVEAQLKALAGGDAATAFAQASPEIRQQFGDAASFVAMVRQGYPMVIRPSATLFFQPESADGVVLQVVQLRDGSGRTWLATYQLTRQPDQRWRISGCSVAPDDGKSST